ncbi:hypothetical protein [Algoriphagus marincola]|uniref:hypothetical protein n=1 Tax=Algoriphagus marincola TaxID=264027 RepID=UPI0004215CAF|nr:hypothetical protein [Algoriphagus marincola]
MDIRFVAGIDKKSAYCLLKGSGFGSFACQPWLGLRSSNQSSKENKVTGMIADIQKNKTPKT